MVIFDVFAESASEETGLLTDDGEVGTQVVDVVILYIHPVYSHNSAAVVKSLKQLHEG